MFEDSQNRDRLRFFDQVDIKPRMHFFTKWPMVALRWSKIFKTFDIRSDLNFSNTKNSRSEHI